MAKVFLKLGGVLFVLIGLAALIWYLLPTEPLTEPSAIVKENNPFSSNITTAQGFEVMAFLPYWFVSQIENIPTPLTSLAYFGIAVSPEGTLGSSVQKKEPWWRTLEASPYQELNKTVQQAAIAQPVVITNFSHQEISQFLDKPEAQARFFTELDELMNRFAFTGVIIDFEPDSPANAELQQKFSEFIARLKAHVGPQKTVDIAVYGNAIAGTSLWDIKELSAHTDRFIIMMYDFHRKSSDQAGPLAPLTQQNPQETPNSILPLLKNYLKVTTREQILLGVPFYGYEWQTVSPEPNAHTFPRSSRTVWQKDVLTLLNDSSVNATTYWDETSLSAFLLYTRDQQSHVISFESWLSFHYKVELVRQLELGGIAIWALGYERENDPLWQEIFN